MKFILRSAPFTWFCVPSRWLLSSRISISSSSRSSSSVQDSSSRCFFFSSTCFLRILMYASCRAALVRSISAKVCLMERIGVIAVTSKVTCMNWEWDLWKLLVSLATAGKRSWMFFNIKLYSGFLTSKAVCILLMIRSFDILSPFYKPPWALEQLDWSSVAAAKSPKSVALPTEAIVM